MNRWRADPRTASRVRFGAITQLEERHPPAKRVVLGLIGLFPLIAPYELWRGLWPLTWASPFFAVIVLGALGVGGMFLASAIVGYEQRWSVEPGRLLVQRRTSLWRERRVLRAGDIARIEPVRHDWSDGEPSFAVALHLAGGERLETPSLPDQASADAIEAELRRHLIGP